MTCAVIFPEPRLVFRCLRVKHDAPDYFAVPALRAFFML
jgi:hypothetical protein